jgi:UDP-N-acetylglucosamine enolpyruvyl transferase
MDYRVIAVFSDGQTAVQNCATNTDVENVTVQFIREMLAHTDKMQGVSINVIKT